MNRELIVDNFAGGGGASTGIEMAIGRSVDIAINHDPNAIAMHTTNHPDTLHYCESVFDIDPVAATAGRPVGLAWFSPDCRHFSKAKGSKPVKKEIRGLAWIVIRWALRTRFRCGMLENVEEFKTWGPLVADADGNERPCPARSGETFAAFVSMLSTGIDAGHPALAECCEVLGIAAGSDDHQRLVAGLGYVVSEKGRQFKAEAVAQVLEQLRRRPRSITGTVSVSVVLCPPNKARRDLDNYFKALFDAMTYAGVWLDDSQVKKIAAEWGPVTKGGKVELRISEVLA
ncbi:hypothetical protein BIY27_10720 [Gibbsiella quercinecans]|uniref:RusA family crossover junction endodeoxyribonuclease n=1 Tax=Gibbsiella quercinecans TaxID=929813 RepID=UPI000EF1F5A6|nr:hypothetical protein BIY27_10720 [Gibbsiella quercinecans]